MAIHDPSPSLTRFKRLARAVQVFITLVFTSFLILLGNKLLWDMDLVAPPVDTESIRAATRDPHLEQQLATLQRGLDELHEKRRDMEAGQQAAQRTLASLNESYAAWLQARHIIGSPDENPEVRAHLRELEGARKARDAWADRIDGVDQEIRAQQGRISDLQAARDAQEQRAWAAVEEAQNARTLRLFLYRLLVVGPLVASAVLLWLRKRRTTLWPLVWGYALFGLYAFFVGLVPYLPDFGGYVRSVVGVVLTALAAVYTARQLKRMIDERTAALHESQEQRASRIQPGDAVKSLLAHTCPACETDYGKLASTPESHKTDAPGFCAICGLKLFAPCAACNTRIFVHLPHCPGCGTRPAIST